MKKVYIFIITTLLFTTTIIAQPAFTWAKEFLSSGSSSARANSVTLDASGNVYTTGSFYGTVDFDPGPGVHNLTSTAGDFYISKLDPSGNLIWVISTGGDEIGPQSIALDASGNIYVTGYFSGTGDFDPGAGIYNLTAVSTSYDIFICKLDASGNFVWAKSIGSTGTDYAYSIAVDALENVYSTGVYENTVDFDPGPGTYNLTSPVSGSQNMYISKLDAAGNFVWAYKVAGSAGYNVGYGVTLDPSGNIYMTGVFSGTADFDPGVGVHALTATSSGDSFVWKLDPSGNFIWVSQMTGTSNATGKSITIDAMGSVLTTGVYNGTIDFDPGAGVYNLTSAGVQDIFVSKLDASGNFIWAKSMGGTGIDQGFSISTDALGNVYTTGSFSGTADFDPGAGTYNLTGNSFGSLYDSKLDASGNLVWAGDVVQSEQGFGIAANSGGDFYTIGLIVATATGDFDPGPAVYNMTGQAAFVFKMASCSVAPTTPGTISGTTTVCSGSSNTYSVTAVSGATSYTWTLPSGWLGTSTTNSITTTAGTTGGNITVTANNTCGNSTAQTLAVTVNTTPSTPGIISGTTTICSGSSNTYSVTSVSGATSYTWTLPSGWSGTSTTNSITATSGTTSGNITVTANNACGASTAQTLVVTVNTIPSIPGTISGTTTICSGSSNTYSVTSVSGAASYTWTLPGGWSGTSTTNSITATAGTTSGNITVTANNTCGNSTAQIVAITVNTVPSTPGTISGAASFCAGSGTQTYSITSVSGATSYTWTLPSGWSGTSPTNTITATPGTTGGTVSVTANNTCGNSSVQTLVVTVNPLPTVTYSQSPSMVCVNATSVALGTASPTGGVFSGTAVTGSTFNASTAGVGTFSIVYTFTDINSCVNSATSNIVVSACTDIQQNTIDNAISIYPNPATSVITLSGIQSEAQITLYNVLGKIILSQQITKDKTEIDLSELNSGIYFVKIKIENNLITKKIIKN